MNELKEALKNALKDIKQSRKYCENQSELDVNSRLVKNLENRLSEIDTQELIKTATADDKKCYLLHGSEFSDPFGGYIYIISDTTINLLEFDTDEISIKNKKDIENYIDSNLGDVESLYTYGFYY